MLDARPLSCVLFDLDGTLLDTAPDLIASLNVALLTENMLPVAVDFMRPYISCGAETMIKQSLKGNASPQAHQRILHKMLDHYLQNIAMYTRFFKGMETVLDTLELKHIKWGVVTNKLQRFTKPLMQALQLKHRATCIISGDSTDNIKPHPKPIYVACQQAKVTPDTCIYVGDSLSDIEAGNRAGTKTLAVTYGYLKPDDRPDSWGATALIKQPSDLMLWINKNYGST